MEITIKLDTGSGIVPIKPSTKMLILTEILNALNRIQSALELQQEPSKEARATLETVKEIIKEPVAPVQQKKPKTKKQESENIKPDHEKKSQKSEIKSLDSEIKKKWTPKQKEDIKAIKEAYKKQKQEREKLKGGGKNNKRDDIDNSLIVYMRDEQHMTIAAIAKELRCAQQTVLNRYNREKRDRAEGEI